MKENLLISVNALVPLFVLIALGFVLTKVGLTNENFNKIANRLCFKVALPVSIFNSIYSVSFAEALRGKLILWATILFLMALVISVILVLLFSKDPKKRGVLLQCAVRSNYVYIGIPICENLFGEEGLVVASTMIPFVVVIFNVSAVLILTIFSGGAKKVDVKAMAKNLVTNPLILAAAIAVVYNLTGLPLPQVASKTLSDIAKLATPMALISLGGSFEFKAVGRQLRYIIFGTSMRMVLVPLIVLTTAHFAGFGGAELAVLFVMFGSPVAISSNPMAVEMNGDGELAGQLVVFTTLSSMFTMFAGVFLMKTLGWM